MNPLALKRLHISSANVSSARVQQLHRHGVASIRPHRISSSHMQSSSSRKERKSFVQGKVALATGSTTEICALLLQHISRPDTNMPSTRTSHLLLFTCAPIQMNL